MKFKKFLIKTYKLQIETKMEILPKNTTFRNVTNEQKKITKNQKIFFRKKKLFFPTFYIFP